MDYVRIERGREPKSITHLNPFKAIVVIEESLDLAHQHAVSKWLVESGCMYMMAWGKDCSSWDDSVDLANIEQFPGSEIPEESFVITTWHENESLGEVIWFAKYTASHASHDNLNMVFVHLSSTDRSNEFKSSYLNA